MSLFRYFAHFLNGGEIYGCTICYNPICFAQDAWSVDDLYLSVKTLNAVNISRIENDEASCICGRRIGQIDGDTLYIYRPIRLSVPPSNMEPRNGVVREWCFPPGNYNFPIWGCVCCQRSLGTGYEFLHHYCLPVSLINSVELDTDRNNIRCVCGCYVGYRHRGYILVGEIVQLNPCLPDAIVVT